MNNTKNSEAFSFAVIADTHLNQSETECNSPFEVNRLANERFSHVVDLLNEQDVAFVVHLGDVVHPVPSMGPLYSDSATRFHEQVARLKHPLHLIPGNHDVGDKPILWGPAGTVRESFLDAWSEHFGGHYFSFTHENAAFIGINAQVIGSGLALEEQQRAWVEKTLDDHSQRRIFMFSHYPPYLHNTDEREHYDNLGVEGRKWMLDLLSRYDVEALFAGHVHNFWYNRYQNSDCYLLPSTAFVRQDYSEMFRVGPGPELGRNDAPKLGFFVVHVTPDGHSFDVIRSQPERPATVLTDTAPDAVRVRAVNPQTNRTPSVGFDLRHDWVETVQIPPSGGLDEFDRKWVRNDYGLLALWDTGVRQLRIPMADLIDATRRARINELHRLGFEFSLYSFGMPDQQEITRIESVAEAIAYWEIAWPMDRMDAFERERDPMYSVRGLANRINVKVYLSPLRSKEDILKAGRKYYHVINHGFTQTDSLTDPIYVDNAGILQAVDGIVYRLGLQDSVWHATQLSNRLHDAQQKRVLVHLRTAPDGLGHEQAQESHVNNRLAQAMVCGWATDSVMFYADSLTDNDRGYFQRLGIVDRLYNPKSSYYVVKYTHALLSQFGQAPMQLSSEVSGRGRWIRAVLPDACVVLLTTGEDDSTSSTFDVASLFEHASERTSESTRSAFGVLDWATGSVRRYASARELIAAMPAQSAEPLLVIEYANA